MNAAPLIVALGEYDTGWHDSRASLASAARLASAASGLGVDLLVLPEMATTGFTMDTARAVSLDSADIDSLRGIARANALWVIVGVCMRAPRDPSRAFNTAVVIDPNGDVPAIHLKRKLFAFGDEDAHYAPGVDATTVTIQGVRIGLFVCYELRFPELFSSVATEVDAMVVIANWPASREEHWDTLLRARAIENQAWVLGVNRVGSANGLEYHGGSTAFDPWGTRTVTPPATGPRIVAVDPSRVASIRAKYPFLRDRGRSGQSFPDSLEVGDAERAVVQAVAGAP